jgi:hypothetical protein
MTGYPKVMKTESARRVPYVGNWRAGRESNPEGVDHDWTTILPGR